MKTAEKVDVSSIGVDVTEQAYGGQDVVTVEHYATDEVPMSQRNIGFFDMIAIWVGANSNNASWYVGGTVAGMAFAGAITVTLISNPIAYLVLALVGYMGFKVGTSTMALTRPAFGIKGSLLPTVLNTIVFLGWAVVNTFIAVISMSFILKGLFGWPAYGEPGSAGPMILGIVFMSILNLAAVSLGRNSIKIVERIGIVLVLALGIWITVVVLKTHSIADIMAWKAPADAIMPVGKAIDIMAAFSLAWVLGIAEFTRYTRSAKTATVAPLLGACLSLMWFAFIGIIATIGAAITTGTFNPDNSDPSSIVTNLGLGWFALVLIVVACITTNVVNLMAAGISITNVTKKIKPLHSIWLVTVLAGFAMLIPLYLASFLYTFMGFLEYIGMVLSALLGILVADYFFVQKRSYDVKEFEKVGGKYWYSKGVNIRAVAVWAFGVVFFLLVRDSILLGNSVGAVYPTIIVTAVLYSLVSLPRRKVANLL
ncbi:cytosine permease [Saccharococcus sp. Marseille-Q5394]|uniref:cytosine permease n=1 Tax=Saccharococcus sp. Marseille-Q5394 TaxID=2972778 RepID=UPI0021CA9C4F|nr:cytosine permease [Saccharococcus sp. Marseille-Q5394]